jgi:hypothetical protein
MRRRLTQAGLFRRNAAPDESSGRNMNTPIILYDTHPNKRFPVGSIVIFVDDKFLRLRGTVLGHAAEDRLWVQWPNEIRQMDVEEVVNISEIQDAEPLNRAGVIGSRGSRQAALLTFEDIDRFNDEDEDEDEDLEFIPEEVDSCNY